MHYNGSKTYGGTVSGVGYAYHFDASLYAPFLRELAEKAGVTRIEGKVVDVDVSPEDGFIRSVTLADGRQYGADLFIDCSWFYGVLIDKVLEVPFVKRRRVRTRAPHRFDSLEHHDCINGGL